MIRVGTYPPISIDFGKDEAGMILQREVKRDQWVDYLENGKPVVSARHFYNGQMAPLAFEAATSVAS